MLLRQSHVIITVYAIVLCPSGHIFNHYTPRKFAGVYSDPYVRPFVCTSPSLIRYSSKTAEQNFMKLSGIVHYMMPYCTSYFKFLSAWLWGFPEQNKDFAIQNMGERGVSFCEHCSQYFMWPCLKFWKYGNNSFHILEYVVFLSKS